MKYVYMLESLAGAGRHYTGVTADVDNRLPIHNAARVRHTAEFRPWRLETYVALSDDGQAYAFERYLKSGSGRAFARKRSSEIQFSAFA